MPVVIVEEAEHAVVEQAQPRSSRHREVIEGVHALRRARRT